MAMRQPSPSWPPCSTVLRLKGVCPAVVLTKTDLLHLRFGHVRLVGGLAPCWLPCSTVRF